MKELEEGPDSSKNFISIQGCAGFWYGLRFRRAQQSPIHINDCGAINGNE